MRIDQHTHLDVRGLGATLSIPGVLIAGFGVILMIFPFAIAQEKPAAGQGKTEAAQEAPASLPRGKKLMLKDGNFHLVREYHREGNLVRYYSVERSAWEEIPAELVDWDATRKAEATESKRQEEAVEKLRTAQAAERATEIDVDASIEVAPGVFLPPGEGLFAVEGRIVTPLVQAAADVKLSKGRLVGQILSPIPIVPSKHRVQLSEKRARHRLTSSQPEFYVRTADAREPEIELLRAQVKGNTRLLEFISTNIAGQQSAKRESISVQRWQVAKGVFRLTVSQRLEPGEYAIAEILPEGMNLFVWDFGIDPGGAPYGQKPASPAPKKAAATSKPKP